MTSRDLIDRASIADVWRALGGGPLRRNRVCAWWRGSESWSVSIATEKNAWFDHGPHKGGGILSLIEVARKCNRRAALEWLASQRGCKLDGRPLSIKERRQWRQKHRQAEARAAELLEWREILLREIRRRRDDIWEGVLAAERFGRQFVNKPGRDDLWNFAFQCLAEEPEGERLDEWVGLIEAMTPAEVGMLRERMTKREAVAACRQNNSSSKPSQTSSPSRSRRI